MTQPRPDPSAAPAPAGHEFVDHTSEITLRLRAPTFPELLAEAARAYAALLPASTERTARDEWREMTLRSADRVATLVEWLNELAYLGEVELWVPVAIEGTTQTRSGWALRARGDDLGDPFVLVKAATLHNAHVRDVPGGLEAEVTLDI